MTALGVAAGVFGAVMVALLAVAAAWSGHSSTPSVAPSSPSPRERSLLKEVPDLPEWLRRVGELAAPSEPAARRAYEMQLTQAGVRDERSVAWFQIGRTAAALSMPLLCWSFRPIWSPYFADNILYTGMMMISASGIGYIIPGFVLGRLRSRRQRRVARAVPGMIDMLVAGVEAGLGVDMALRHVSGELHRSAPELGREVAQANSEVSAGIPRDDALGRMVERTGVEALASLVKVLGQVEKYGSSVGASLRSHARLTRRRRLLEAEQRAANASPLLTVVMIVLILPALFIVLLGPAALNVVKVVGS